MSTAWSDPAGYESYVGRWSRILAPSFLSWLSAPRGHHWLDVGCGTGALTEAVLRLGDAMAVQSIDAAQPYLRAARRALTDPRVTFEVGNATALPYQASSCDVVVSGLLLNFLDADQAIAEQCRVAKPGGLIAAYVWDYAGEYELVRRFWDVAKTVDESAEAHDPAIRFPICNVNALADLLARHGLRHIRTTRLAAVAQFGAFVDYWSALDARQGSLASYLSGLTESTREAIRCRLAEVVGTSHSPVVRLKLCALAVAGVR